MTRNLWVALAALLVAQVALAQEDIIVPDVTGLRVPAAAAALNRVGIILGQEYGQPWSTASDLSRDTVIDQSIPPGTAIAPASAVDLTVLRAPNMLLRYDDNDLTLVNQSSGVLDLTGITFQALDGDPATFDALRWGRDLREHRCGQVWSVNRDGPKGLEACDYIQHWLTTTDPAEHFWTGRGGTTRFSVTQDDIERAVCQVANPGECAFYLPVVQPDDLTEHVYIAYTTGQLAIINNTEANWMPLAGLTLGNRIVPADPALYDRDINPAANVQQLAPGQCIVFAGDSELAQTPQPCDVIARLDMEPDRTFWEADFSVDNASDTRLHRCPMAQPDHLTLCILPR